MTKVFLASLVGLALVATSRPAAACSVPVFRFALERWISDNYALVVAHDQPLGPEQRALVDRLVERSADTGGTANLTVQVLDVSATPDDPAVKHLPLDQIALPAVFLFFPAGFGEPTLVWKAPLTAGNLARLTRSPTRDEFLAQAVQGVTATWVLIESGRRAADDDAAQVLGESLTAAQQELELPAGVIQPSGEVTGGDSAGTADNGYFDPENQLESGIPLRIAFAVIRIPADDMREDVLRGMLMNVVPGLAAKRGQPLAFPVFGRGRILEPLAGTEIRHANIAAVCRYLCGPCACQIKARNPGVDMLLDVDWVAKLAGKSAMPARGLPPLSGTAEITGDVPQMPMSAIGLDDGPPPPAGDVMRPEVRSVLWAATAVLLLMIVATLGIVRKQP